MHLIKIKNAVIFILQHFIIINKLFFNGERTIFRMVLKIYPPPIAYMPFETSILSISMGNPTFINWINSHFTQIGLYFLPDDYTGVITPTLSFIDTPAGLNINALPTKLFNNKANIDFLDGLKFFLEKGYYIFIYVDKFYLPNYYNYNTSHDVHSVLLYGLEENTVWVADFFRDGKFTFEQCCKNDFNKAINIFSHISLTPYGKENDMLLIKPSEDNYIFDVNILKNDIKNYLNSTSGNTRVDTSLYKYFGISNYQYILNYLDEIYKCKMQLDYRMFSFHVSHKNLLYNKVLLLKKTLRLNQLESLNHKVKDLLRICNINQALSLKYNISNDLEIICRIIKNINLLLIEEQQILLSLLKII